VIALVEMESAESWPERFSAAFPCARFWNSRPFGLSEILTAFSKTAGLTSGQNGLRRQESDSPPPNCSRGLEE
jgi:hypothetical protein